MEIEMQGPAPPPYTPGDATFAELSTEVYKLGVEFHDPLVVFRKFWIQGEQIRFSRNQLKTLTNQGIYVLKTCAKRKSAGGDVSRALPAFKKTFKNLTAQIEVQAQLESAIQNQGLVDKLEFAIASASEDLVTQVQELNYGEDAESIMYRDELPQARENDRRRMELLPASIKNALPDQNLNAAITRLMEESLRIIRDTTVGQERVDAKRTLAILADLTGQPLPSNTILDREFVTIGEQAIHQGPSYDIFKGEYFTGEKIAIKVLRHRVDAETAKRTHERFARQAINWSALRHDVILPFYGAGVLRSPVVNDEFQLYVVSPYLQNQDIGRYLKRYSDTSASLRLQMCVDIARGLEYMHAGPGLAQGYGLVHSALNISNVLVKDSGHVVISGFGHAKLVIEGRPETFTGDNADYRYMGPEMLDEAVLTYGTDIWSWAMTTLEILTDEPPFGRKTKSTKIIQMIAANKRPIRQDHPKLDDYECKDDIWQLFEECWQTQPQDRPEASEVVQRLHRIMMVGLNKASQQPGKLWDPPISRNLTTEQVIQLLRRHGCPDVSADIWYDKCSSQPYAVGGFGDVYAGCLHNGSAAKEIYTCSKHRHQNILSFIGLARYRDQIALITPWMDNGTVINYIRLHLDANRCKISEEVASGLAYLHERGSIHGDLKGMNILISRDGVPMITDFGTSVLKQYTLGFTNQEMVSQFSLRWAAPELLDEGSASQEADIYALGMTILEILTTKEPYDYLQNRAVIGQVSAGIIPRRPINEIPEKSVSGNLLWELLRSCWAKTPTKRPSAKEVERVMSSITPKDLQSLLDNDIAFESENLISEPSDSSSWYWGILSGSAGSLMGYLAIMAQSCV